MLTVGTFYTVGSGDFGGEEEGGCDPQIKKRKENRYSTYFLHD